MVLNRYGQPWSPEEIKVAVEAYVDMLHKQDSGEPVNKSAVVEALAKAELAGRTEASVSMRFCNISAVLAARQHRTVTGFSLLKNVGRKNTDEILRHLAKLGIQQ